MSALLSDHSHAVSQRTHHDFDQVGTELGKIENHVTEDTLGWSKDEQDWVSMVLTLSHREGSFCHL